MGKNLRIDVTDNEFHRFKRLKAELGADTNDEALVALMDSHED